MSALRNMTAEELFHYSHPPFRTELVAGRLFEMEPAGALHGAAAARICRLLANHVIMRELGEVFGAETGYVLETDPDTVRAPDASYVSSERWRDPPPAGPKGFSAVSDANTLSVEALANPAVVIEEEAAFGDVAFGRRPRKRGRSRSSR